MIWLLIAKKNPEFVDWVKRFKANYMVQNVDDRFKVYDSNLDLGDTIKAHLKKYVTDHSEVLHDRPVGDMSPRIITAKKLLEKEQEKITCIKAVCCTYGSEYCNADDKLKKVNDEIVGLKKLLGEVCLNKNLMSKSDKYPGCWDKDTMWGKKLKFPELFAKVAILGYGMSITTLKKICEELRNVSTSHSLVYHDNVYVHSSSVNNPIVRGEKNKVNFIIRIVSFTGKIDEATKKTLCEMDFVFIATTSMNDDNCVSFKSWVDEILPYCCFKKENWQRFVLLKILGEKSTQAKDKLSWGKCMDVLHDKFRSSYFIDIPDARWKSEIPQFLHKQCTWMSLSTDKPSEIIYCERIRNIVLIRNEDEAVIKEARKTIEAEDEELNDFIIKEAKKSAKSTLDVEEPLSGKKDSSSSKRNPCGMCIIS